MGSPTSIERFKSADTLNYGSLGNLSMRVDCRAISPFTFMCIKPKSTLEELFTRGGYIRALSIPMLVSPLKPLTYFVTVVVVVEA